MSGEINELRPPDTRGLTNGQIRVSDDSPAKTETVAATKTPAAIINDRLDRLLIRKGERAETPATQSRTAELTPSDGERTISFDNPSTSMLAQHVQSQIAAKAEVAVLAQAHQLPNQAMAFSSYGE